MAHDPRGWSPVSASSVGYARSRMIPPRDTTRDGEIDWGNTRKTRREWKTGVCIGQTFIPYQAIVSQALLFSFYCPMMRCSIETRLKMTADLSPREIEPCPSQSVIGPHDEQSIPLCRKWMKLKCQYVGGFSEEWAVTSLRI